MASTNAGAELLEIGTLIVIGIFALAIWQKGIVAGGLLTQSGAAANRSNAWTQLGFDAGLTGLNDLQSIFNNATPYGS